MEPRTIVVADDETSVAEAVKYILEGQGYRVVAVNDGRSAMEVIPRVRPDVALLDVLMPEVEGFDVCRFVKSQQDLRHMKVIIITALSSEFDLESARSAGADSYITKPFAIDGLLNEIERLISMRDN
jgi:DNA-binding response OmpR family regulator